MTTGRTLMGCWRIGTAVAIECGSVQRRVGGRAVFQGIGRGDRLARDWQDVWSTIQGFYGYAERLGRLGGMDWSACW